MTPSSALQQPEPSPSSSPAAPSSDASWWVRLSSNVRAFGFREHVIAFRPDELHRVRTDDGAHISLSRYLPRGERRFNEHVILCHGLGANRYTFDLEGRYALARRLAERGFEAWILELRGRGEAGRTPAAQMSFDRQVDFDVTSALRTVRAAGAEQVLWVGHSKGGLVALGHLGKNPDAPITGLVTVGSPTSFSAQRKLKPFARVVRPLLAAPAVPIQNLSRLALFVPPPDWFMRYLARPENMHADIRKKALVNVGADVSGGVGRQFLSWISSGRWDSEDGAFDYTKGLSRIDAPALLIAGSHDFLAPPESVANTARHLAGPAELVIAGSATGFREDYGHGDLMLGKHAPEELYPRIIDFLVQCATASSGVGSSSSFGSP